MNLTSNRHSQFSARWVSGVHLWLTAVILATLGQQAAAADFPVPNTGDPLANGAALVAAINAAMRTVEEDDRVLLDPGVHYVLAAANGADPNTGLPVINSGITIRGGYDPKGYLTTIERQAGSGQFRVLLIQPQIQWVKQPNCAGPEPMDIKPTVRLEYIHIGNGDVVDTAHYGGGILNQDGRLFLFRSEVSNNRADFGGGIANSAYVVEYTNVCSGDPVRNTSFAGDVSIAESSVHDNHALGSGGGLYNAAVMRIDHSTIAANQGDEEGGGINNAGTLEMANSTVSGNSNTGPAEPRPGDAAGGIQNSGRLTVSFSTVAFNQGSGIANASRGDAVLSDTILAGNVAHYIDEHTPPLPYDCFGALRSLGYNLIGVVDSRSLCTVASARGDQIGLDRAAPIDPKLAPLAANGGFTQTHALLTGSPAINRANSASSVCPLDDQRGIVRRRIPGDACDVGALERVEPGTCGLDCDVWRIVSVCARNPFVCEKLIVPKIEKLPQVPNCLLDGPGCGPLPPLEFQ